MKLEEMDNLIGRSITTSRARTPAEEAAYGGPGIEGGSGRVIAVGPVETITLEYDGVTSSLTGRRIDVDWGFFWLVTEGDTITPYDESNMHPRRTGFGR